MTITPKNYWSARVVTGDEDKFYVEAVDHTCIFMESQHSFHNTFVYLQRYKDLQTIMHRLANKKRVDAMSEELKSSAKKEFEARK